MQFRALRLTLKFINPDFELVYTKKKRDEMFYTVYTTSDVRSQYTYYVLFTQNVT